MCSNDTLVSSLDIFLVLENACASPWTQAL